MYSFFWCILVLYCVQWRRARLYAAPLPIMKGVCAMPIRYKVDVLAALKAAGFTSYKIRKDGLINQTALQRIREGKLISWEQLATVCKLLKCQPGDLLEYAEDSPAED